MFNLGCLGFVRSLILWALVLASREASAGLPETVVETQTIDWTLPSPDKLAVLGKMAVLNASASSGGPVTFRVDEGPGKITTGRDPGSGQSIYFLMATNPGPITMVAEQAGGMIGGKSYLPTSVRRSFNRTLVAESLISERRCSFYDYLGGPPACGLAKVFIHGNHAFFDSRNSISMWDLSNLSVQSNRMYLDHFSEPIKDLTVSGSILFAAVGKSGIGMIDMTNPSKPKSLGRYEVGGDATSIQVKGDVAYVATGENGVRIIDVSQPPALVPRGLITNAARSTLIQVQSKTAYVATDDPMATDTPRGALQIYDLSIPSAPVRLGSFPASGQVIALQVVDNTVYLVDLVDGLQLIDVSTPSNPKALGNWKVSGCKGFSLVGRTAYLLLKDNEVVMVDTNASGVINQKCRFRVDDYVGFGFIFPFDAKSINAVGDHLYMVGDSGLEVLRLSENEPQRLTIDTPPTVELGTLTLKINASSSSGLPLQMKVKSGPAELEGEQLLLKDIGTVVLQFSQAGDLRYAPITEDRTLLITSSKQPQTISWVAPDAAKTLLPNRPYPVQAVSSSGLPVTVRVMSGPAYFTQGSLFVNGAGSISLMAEQVGNDLFERASSVRTLVGSNLMFPSDHPVSRLGGNATKIFTQGMLAYLIVEESKYESKVEVINIGDLSDPKVVATIKMPGWTILDVQAVGSMAYVTYQEQAYNGKGGVAVVNALSEKTILGSYGRVGLRPKAVRVKGSFAYIVDDTGALEVVDFSDPTQSVIKGKLKIFDEPPKESSLIELQGDRLYAFKSGQSYGRDSSLIVIDVGNPTAPRRIGNEKCDISDARSMCVFGNSVYIAEIADLNGGVLVHRIDVSDPVSPLKKEVWGMSRSEVFWPRSIRVVGDLLYLAHGNGVSVSDMRETRYHKVSLFKTLGDAHDIKIFDDYICVADGVGGLQILSPSPAILGQPTPIDADQIRIRVQGGIRSRVLIESSRDLRNWEPETYRASLIPSEVTLETGGEARFYRALKGPQGFVWIQPGTFMMGSPLTEQGREPDEVQHSVTLTQGFWMSDHEVTVGEFSKNGNTWPAFVPWEDAVKYCEELTQRERVAGRIGANQVYRLPTEAEWEYAARAGTTGPRYAETNSLGVLWKDVRPALRSVMLDDPNPWGLYDMIGNASEWCSDWYAEYPAGPVTDPTGPESGRSRVIRGQGFEGELFDLPSPQTFRSAERGRRGDATGFRVVLSTVPIR